MSGPHPICQMVGIRMPCLASIYVLAGIHAPCEVCVGALERMRCLHGWEPLAGTDFFFSNHLLVDQQKRLWLIFDFWTAKTAKQKAELGEILELVRSAQRTLSVEDYGDALLGAERRLVGLLGSGEQRAEGVEPEQEKGGLGA